MKDHDCRLFFDVLRWTLHHDSLEHSRALEKLLNQLGHAEFSSYWHQIRRLPVEHKETLSRAFSAGQIESKLWLAEVLAGVVPNQAYNICIVAGWIGVLPRIMCWLYPHLVRRIVLVEVDPVALELGRKLNADLMSDGLLELVESDANQFHYDYDFHLIINCACEHFAQDDWYKKIPAGRLVVTQSSNAPAIDHVRTVRTVNELTEQYPVELALYGGSLYLPEGKRFMRIGRK